jgi:GT2 family glycosyltransferase/glycosyltransferase involved in cell wall biosynthesis
VLTREDDPAEPEYRVRRETRDGVPIVWVNNTFRQVRSFEETYANPAIGDIASRLIDEFRPDVAHVHHLTCLSTTIVRALAERRVPCVFTLHDYWLLCHRGQLLDRACRVCDGPGRSGCASCLDAAAGAARIGFAAAPAIRAIARRLPSAAASVLRRTAGLAAATVSRAETAADHSRRRTDHMRQLCGDVTRFLAPSRHLRERFLAFGVSPDRITDVSLGVDHAPFQNLSRTPTRRLRLGFLGTLMISKAPHVLLDAVRRLPPGAATVDLFGAIAAYHGDDSYRSQLEPLFTTEGVRAHGPLPHDRIVQALGSIDLLVVPSIWPENSPLVVREAFLAGVPVVASRIGGLPEAVEDGRNGLLFRAGDADDLARTLRRFLDEPDLLDALRAGIPAVRSIEDDVRFTREIYEDAIRAGRPAAHLPDAPRLAAVVLNYRTPDETWLAVKSLLASRRPFDDIIVVNNDGAPDAPAAWSALSPRIRCIDTGANLGFPGGMNVGIRAALDRGARRVLLVNSDTIVPPDCAARLERCLDAVPQSGIAGPQVLMRSDPGRVASHGLKYTDGNGRMRQVGFGERVAALDVPNRAVVDGIDGCLMLVTREVFDAIGLLDEEYFFAFEDLDFCLRARRAGFSTMLAGDARVYHEGGRSIGAGSPRRLYFAARNHLRLARRCGSPATPLRSSWRSASIVALNLAHATVSRGAPLPARLRAVARGTTDYFRGRFGAGPA